MRKPYAIWRDRRGRLSTLRLGALALLVWPAILASWAATTTTGFWARPINDLIHRTGFWALIFLLLSLAVTPFRHVARFGQLIDIRRMVGVGAFVYAALHLSLYVLDQKGDLLKVGAEIMLRSYLTVGIITLLGLALLAATSTDASVRRLGGQRWRRLHRSVYLVGVLALIHYFQQTKADLAVPTLVAGLFGWLMAYRLLAALWEGSREHPLASLLLLAAASGLLTLVAEAVGIGLAFGVPPLLVLSSAFDVDAGIRPGWIVLAAGLAVASLDLLRARWTAPAAA
jgi:sulfoxide reductase heme-binding subunit YedZ